MDYFRNSVVTTTDLIICGVVTLFLLAATGVAFAVIGSSRGKLQVIDQDIARLTQELAQAKQVAAQQDALEAKIADVKVQIAAFEARLPAQDEIPELLDRFQHVASQSGIQYQQIVAEASQEQPLYVKLPFTVNVRGRYPQFGQFLRDLEFGQRFIKVEHIELERETDSVSNAKFSISTYTFIEDEAPPQAGGGA